MRRVSRPVLIGLIPLAFVLFLAISTVVARIFSVDDAERAAIVSLIQAQARGDATGMVRELYRCDAACRQRVAHDAVALKETGHVQIAEINTSAGFSFASTTGTARVAWYAGNPRPVVQCIRVQRAGNVFTGFTIRLLKLGDKLPFSDESCPRRY
ncbi:MAG: hypothetical protein ACYDHH_11575 [Solirubrobacteraceae bacterium]